MPVFTPGTTTFTVGISTFTVGMPTFTLGIATFAPGMATFAVGTPVFTPGTATFTPGTEVCGPGKRVVARGKPNLRAGTAVLKDGTPSFKVWKSFAQRLPLNSILLGKINNRRTRARPPCFPKHGGLPCTVRLSGLKCGRAVERAAPSSHAPNYLIYRFYEVIRYDCARSSL
jgi:hypothetical protein